MTKIHCLSQHFFDLTWLCFTGGRSFLYSPICIGSPPEAPRRTGLNRTLSRRGFQISNSRKHATNETNCLFSISNWSKPPVHQGELQGLVRPLVYLLPCCCGHFLLPQVTTGANSGFWSGAGTSEFQCKQLSPPNRGFSVMLMPLTVFLGPCIVTNFASKRRSRPMILVKRWKDRKLNHGGTSFFPQTPVYKFLFETRL